MKRDEKIHTLKKSMCNGVKILSCCFKWILDNEIIDLSRQKFIFLFLFISEVVVICSRMEVIYDDENVLKQWKNLNRKRHSIKNLFQIIHFSLIIFLLMIRVRILVQHHRHRHHRQWIIQLSNCTISISYGNLLNSSSSSNSFGQIKLETQFFFVWLLFFTCC